MLKFDEYLNIDHLPIDIYEALIAELNRDNSWKTVAKYLSNLSEEDAAYTRYDIKKKTFMVTYKTR